MTTNGADDQPVTDRGKNLEIRKKQADGKLEVHRGYLEFGLAFGCPCVIGKRCFIGN